MIPFNRPTVVGSEFYNLEKTLERRKFAGGGAFSRKCNKWLGNYFSCVSFVTTSCTHSLEMAALLCELAPGDEVILPSYAFSSTATAFVRSGAKLVFVDVLPGTMNIDPFAVERAISSRTRAIVVLHYGGVACDMEKLSELAGHHNIYLVEDAAQAMFSTYKGKPCGQIGDFGCISFHESKNIQCGEGGAFICGNSRYAERAEIILEKGTNRTKFFQGEVDKYTWIDIGSSFVLSDLNSAFLLAQLEHGDIVTRDRLASWNKYMDNLKPLVDAERIEVADIPDNCKHNGHMFWIKVSNVDERAKLMDYLKERDVHSVFHYQPLHSSPAGRRYGDFSGDDLYTTSGSERLLRLPLFYGFDNADYVSEIVLDYYNLA